MKNNTLFNSNYDLYFEPKNPITTPHEFIDEIIDYFSKKNQFVSILDECMEPKIKINDEEYICKLDEPFRQWKFFKTPINPIAGRFLGYKWVYIYKLS